MFSFTQPQNSTPKANLAVKMDIRNAQVDYRLEIEPKLFLSKSSFGEDGIDNVWYKNPVKKIEVSVEEGEVDVFSKRFNLGEYLTVQGVAGYKHRPEGPEDSKFSFNYRIASRHWDQATKSLKKYEVKPHERVSAAVRWDVTKRAPDAEGVIESKRKPKFDVDIGCYHVTIPRIDFKLIV